MKRANIQLQGTKEPAHTMAKRTKRSAEDGAANLVRAARRFVGHDDDEPQDEEEAAFIAKLRKELPRPTAEEMADIAKRLVRRSSDK